MSNSAYLRLVGGPRRKHRRELYCEYSLPDGWANLFGPDDLHVGRKCPLRRVCRRHTTSYLLTDAATALARFEARMAAAGVPLTGDGLVARFFEFLQEEFDEGWLFADTTELQCMSERFVEDTRALLRRRETTPYAFQPTANSFLMEFGWGTGLSTEERKQQPAEAP